MQTENQRLPETIHESWHPYLQPLFNDARMDKIKSYILPRKPFYPISAHIFRVFSMPIQDIRVVILGQDVYPNGQGIGLAFAVNHTVEIPPSLRTIYTEIEKEATALGLEYSLEFDSRSDSWRELQHWRKQGVFLLNTALTVERGEPNSHSEHWSWFTKEIVRIIAEQVQPVWLMWGREAQRFELYIDPKGFYKDFVDSVGDKREQIPINSRNWIIKAPHPAAGLREGNSLFIGCNNFYYCNQILKAKGYEPIKW